MRKAPPQCCWLFLKSHSFVQNYYRHALAGVIRLNVSLPGRDRGGGPRRPGCAKETEASTRCVAASSPVSPPASPQQSPRAPLVLGSVICTDDNGKSVRSHKAGAPTRSYWKQLYPFTVGKRLQSVEQT